MRNEALLEKSYIEATERFVQYPKDQELNYITIGLCGEVGELANKIKKIIRGDDNITSEMIRDELGDILFYIARVCKYFNLTLDECFESNILKLDDRLKRNKIKGSGDNR